MLCTRPRYALAHAMHSHMLRTHPCYALTFVQPRTYVLILFLVSGVLGGRDIDVSLMRLFDKECLSCDVIVNDAHHNPEAYQTVLSYISAAKEKLSFNEMVCAFAVSLSSHMCHCTCIIARHCTPVFVHASLLTLPFFC